MIKLVGFLTITPVYEYMTQRNKMNYEKTIIEDRVDSYITIAKIKYPDKTADEIIYIIENGTDGMRFNSKEEKELFSAKWSTINDKNDINTSKQKCIFVWTETDDFTCMCEHIITFECFDLDQFILDSVEKVKSSEHGAEVLNYYISKDEADDLFYSFYHLEKWFDKNKL
jgi:hypothetical protein